MGELDKKIEVINGFHAGEWHAYAPSMRSLCLPNFKTGIKRVSNNTKHSELECTKYEYVEFYMCHIDASRVKCAWIVEGSSPLSELVGLTEAANQKAKKGGA
jgi:hypothetical protein